MLVNWLGLFVLHVLICLLSFLCYIRAGAVPQLGTRPPSSAITSVATIASAVNTRPLATTVPVTSTGTNAAGSQTTVIAVTDARTTPTATRGTILSTSLQPVSARLTRRILAGEIVEMRDLLVDNMALYDQLESLHRQLMIGSTPGVLRTRLREVPSLISWVYCFLAYVTVRATDPVMCDMLTYCRLIIREALRHGGRGWQDYDRTFRSQAAIDQTMRWNVILPELQACTILGQRSAGGMYCSLCTGIDHSISQCALSVLQQPLTTHVPASNRRPSNLGDRRPSGIPIPICSSWNAGRCIYPGTCSFRHVCATCGQHHKAHDCDETPSGSPYRRNSRDNQPPSSSRSGERPKQA